MSTTTDLQTFKINYLSRSQYEAAKSGGTINENELYMIQTAEQPFYNVVDYGILPDSGDVYSALYDLLADYVYDTGGTVYFPAGKYTLSYTIFIPENTTFIGDGADTEIYFDETDPAFGVGLSNAGSNVTIRNLKVSQKTVGTFGTGAQHGCIGFSDLDKTQAKVGKKVHTFIRANSYNLTAENLYFDGIYPIQTENSSTGTIRNVIYRNLYCPTGCVSAMSSTANMHNVLIENVTCDLLRISLNQTAGKIYNATIRNVECQNLYLRNSNDADCRIMVSNLIQTTNTRNNTFMTAGDACYVNCNATFNGCTFNALSSEVYGMHLYKGIRVFQNCIFNMYQKVITRGSALSDTDNYEYMNKCILNAVDTINTNGAAVGYGRDNIINASRFVNFIWGDAKKAVAITTGNGAVSSTTHPSRVIVDGTKIRLSIYLGITTTSDVATLPTKITNLPLFGEAIPIAIWDSSDRATQTQTFAKIENGTLKVAEVGLNNSTAYDRALVEYDLELTSLPTPSQIYNLLA